MRSRFEAYLPTWLTFGTWTVDQACRILSGIPTTPIERQTDLDGAEHLKQKANYDHLVMIAKTYPDLSIGAPPAQWIEWATKIGYPPPFGISEVQNGNKPVAFEAFGTESRGVTKAEILGVEWPTPNGAPTIESILDKIPKWAEEACIKVGRAGKGSHLWNPAMFAVCLATRTSHKQWVSNQQSLTSLLRNHFSEYLDEWSSKRELL